MDNPTHPASDQAVLVTQADREIAVSVLPPIVRAEVLAGLHDEQGDCAPTVQAFARHRTSAPRPVAGEDLADRFWLIVREPGMVPDRKGPWQHRDTAKVIREFIAARPRAFIDVLTIGPDGTPDVQHGPEALQMADGRSMTVGSKHNARVRDAAEAALQGAADQGGVREDDLAWFSGQHRLSLQFYSPMYGDDDDQSEEWRVDKESGPINDREWETVGRGASAAEAIAAARAALTGGQRS